MKIHIVKRNLNLSDDKSLNQKASTGFLSQSASGRKPVGWDAKIGDQIWVHEVGYGITKYGTVTRKSTDIYVVPEGDFTSLINLLINAIVKINKDGIAQFNILAASYAEAECRAWDFINGKDIHS